MIGKGKDKLMVVVHLGGGARWLAGPSSTIISDLIIIIIIIIIITGVAHCSYIQPANVLLLSTQIPNT